MSPRIIFVFLIFSSISFTKAGFMYEEGEWETMIVDLITRALIPIHLEEFVDDPELFQKVDERRKVSYYGKMTPGGSENTEGEEMNKIYTRQTNDKGDPIIVLRSTEDNLKFFGKKRTFVALRQNPLTNNTYFVSYVYLR